jgi:hypothetical protein
MIRTNKPDCLHLARLKASANFTSKAHVWRHDIQHDDIQHDDIQHDDIQHDDIQQNNK